MACGIQANCLRASGSLASLPCQQMALRPGRLTFGCTQESKVSPGSRLRPIARKSAISGPLHKHDIRTHLPIAQPTSHSMEHVGIDMVQRSLIFHTSEQLANRCSDLFLGIAYAFEKRSCS